MGALIVISIILGLLILAAIIYFVYLYLWEKIDPQDYTLFRHYMPQYTKGYIEGILVDIFYHKNRTGFKFYPTDVDQYGYHVKNIHIFSFPKGTLSKERNIIEALAPNADEYTNTFKQTPLGKQYMLMTEKLNNLELENEVMREASARRAKLLKDWAGGEAISPDILGNLQKWNEDFVKTITSGKGDKNLTGLPSNFMPRSANE